MIFPDGDPAPNLDARKISLRFPVRLNLLRVQLAKQHSGMRESVPVADELFRIAVHVCGVPGGATRFVDRIEHLSAQGVSGLVLRRTELLP
jgi:hypothetical protein